MKEQMQPTYTVRFEGSALNHLTNNSAPPTLERGVIFMAEGSVENTGVPNAPTKTIPRPEGMSKHEALRGMWNKAIPLEEQKKPDVREDSNPKPSQKPEREEVLHNAKLNDEERLREAARLLGFKRDFTKPERDAILETHNIGKKVEMVDGKEVEVTEEGKDGGEAGVFNYKTGHLLRKTRILKSADFDPQQIRALMEAGIVGAPAVPPRERVGFDTRGLLTTELGDVTREVLRLWDGSNLTETQIEEILSDVRRMPDIPNDVRVNFANMMGDIRYRLSRSEQSEEQRRYDEREKNNRGFYGNKPLTKEKKAILLTGSDEDRDLLFNKLFISADTRSREQFRQAFGQAAPLEYDEFIRVLTEAKGLSDDPESRKEFDFLTDEQIQEILKSPESLTEFRETIDERIFKYTTEMDARESIHNAYFAIQVGVTTDKLSEYLQGFRAEMADLVFGKKGVVEALHFYEQALIRIREENEGYIPEEDVVGVPKKGKRSRAEELTRQQLRRAVPGMEGWEEDRAISIGRGMSIITGRAIEIAATSRMPKNSELISLYAQDIIKDLAPFRHTVGKYNIEEDANKVLGYFMNKKRQLTYDELKELEHGGHKLLLQTVNGLVKGENQRYLSVLNPWKVGGLFTRTTWRTGTAAEGENPLPTLVGQFTSAEEQKWIGTGILIEKERGNLTKDEEFVDEDDPHKLKPRTVFGNPDVRTLKQQAEIIIEHSLKKTARILPLRLFLSNKAVQDKVLKEGSYGTIKDPELQKDIDELIYLQEKKMQGVRKAFSIENRDERIAALGALEDSTLDFASSDRAERVERLANLIKDAFTEGGNNSELNTFMVKLRDKDWEIPYVFGTEDLPYDHYKFGTIGGTGIHRIWRDAASAKNATTGLSDLLKTMAKAQKPEDLLKPLEAIHEGISGYDKALARSVTKNIAEGIMKFYGKDFWSRLPLLGGTISSALTGKASFGQFAYGRGSMAWDELEASEFTRLLRAHHLISEDEQHELQKNAGGGKKEVAWALARTIIPLLILAMIYNILSKASKEVTIGN